jgi:hypothetical protein
MRPQWWDGFLLLFPLYVACAGTFANQALALSGGSRGSNLLIAFSTIAIMPVLIAFPIGVAGIACLIIKPFRAFAWRCIVVSVSMTLVLFLMPRWGEEQRMAGLKQAAERGAPLIEAIRRYEAQHGQPPQRLNQLVPQYIGEIPPTGVRMAPQFELISDPEILNSLYSKNPWVLSVNCAVGWSFDAMYYYPRQNYPDRIYEGPTERIGDWIYVYD